VPGTMRFITVLLFLLSVGASGQKIHKDSVVYNFESAEKANPYSIYKLSLTKYLEEKKSLPKEILKYKNLKELYIGAPTLRVVKNKVYYGESKLKELPEWLNELPELERIELRGNKEFDFAEELPHLSNIKTLRTLEIEISVLTPELVAALCEFKQLKYLILYSTEKNTDLKALETCLKECKIYVNVP
jgi:hypothetical protein